MLPSLRARRYLETHASCGCRHLDRSTEYGLPRRKRQVQIQVVAAGPVQRMRSQADIEIEIPIAPAVDAVTPFAGHAQSLSVRGTLGNARLKSMRGTPQSPALVVLRHVQIQVDLSAVISVLDADGDRGFEVLTRHRHAGAGACSTCAQMREQISQIHLFAGEWRVAWRPPLPLLLPIRWRPPPDWQ